MRSELPTYQEVMLPLLTCAQRATGPLSILEALPQVAQAMDLTEAQLAERLPSGAQGAFHNRLGWAKHYLTRAGLLESTKRGRFQLTEAGHNLLKQGPATVDTAFLATLPAFKEWKTGEINSFIGALNVKKANKGLFVTASSFTKQAKDHVAASSVHVVAIDGPGLAELMARYRVGVRVRDVIELKSVDEAFFVG